MLDEKHEEILEALWSTGERKEYSIQAISKRCSVDFTDSDLSDLEDQGLINRKDDNIEFTEKGKKIAQMLIRRHRLAETLFSSILMLKQSDMEEIACKIEHSLLPEVEESICTLLGHPGVCPDGKPIPKGKCCKTGLKVVDSMVVGLNELNAGERGKISYIKPVTHSNFHQLISFGLHPGVIVSVHRKTPTLCIKFENTELAIDEEVAKSIYVLKLQNDI